MKLRFSYRSTNERNFEKGGGILTKHPSLSRISCLLVAFALVMSLIVVPEIETYAYSGSGTSSSPWIVSSASDLYNLSNIIANNPSYRSRYNYIKLGAEITATSSFDGFGTKAYPFFGTIDGNGYGISNLTSPLIAYGGGNGTNNVIVQNMRLSGSMSGSAGGNYAIVAGIIKNAYAVEFSNLYVNFSSTASVGNMSGIVARVSAAYFTMENCASVGSFSNINMGSIGGLIGSANISDGAVINDSYYCQSGGSSSSSMYYKGAIGEVDSDSCNIAINRSGSTFQTATNGGITSSSFFGFTSSTNPSSFNTSGKWTTSTNSCVTYSCPTAAMKAPTFSGSTSFSKTYGNGAFSLGQSVNSGGALSYSSNNTGVATVNSSGTVSIAGAGTAKITVSASPKAPYYGTSRTVTVSVAKATPMFGGNTSFSKTYGNGVFSLGQSVNSGGKLTYSSNNTNVATVDASGNVTIKGAGTATITVSAAATGNYNSGSRAVTVSVGKAAPTFSGRTSFSKTYGNGAFSLGQGVNSGGKLTYSSNNTGVATVNSSGTVTVIGVGTATITVSAAATGNYNSGSRGVTVSVGKGTPSFTGGTSFSKNYGDGQFNLGQGVNSGGTLSYSSNNTNVATVDASGNVTIKGAGTATITVSAAATSNYNSSSRPVTVTVGKGTPTFSGTTSFSKPHGADFALGQSINSGGTLSYSSNNTGVATVNSSGIVTPVSAGTATITVSAAATGNYSAASRDVTVTITSSNPSAPQSFAAASGQDRKITLSWLAPSSNGGKNITGYIIQRSTDGENFFEIATVSGSTFAYVDNKDDDSADGRLVNGKTYSYKIFAKNADYESAQPATVSGKPFVPPTEVQNLRQTDADTESVTIAWENPASDGGDALQTVKVRVYSDAEYTNEITSSVTVNINSDNLGAVISGLEVSKKYYIEVESVNNAVKDDVHGGIAKVEAKTFTVPDAPQNVDAKANSKNSVKVTWEEPAYDGGTEVTGYILSYKLKTDETWTEVKDIAAEAREYTVEGLTQGVVYEFKVRAVNIADENGGADSEAVEMIPAEAPAAPVLGELESKNGGILIYTITNTDNHGNKIKGYNVYVREVGAEAWSDAVYYEANDGENAKEILVENLENIKNYEVMVKAVNEYGEGAESNIKTKTAGLPTVPQNVTVTPQENQMMLITFNPSDGQGNEITKYVISIGGTIAGEEAELVTVSNERDEQGNVATSFIYNAGTRWNGDAITAKVVAWNAAGCSAESDMGAAYVGAPGAPQLTGLTTDENGIDLSWTASEAHGNALKEYTVYICDKDGKELAHFSTGKPNVLNMRIDKPQEVTEPEASAEPEASTEPEASVAALSEYQFKFEPKTKYTVKVTCTNFAGEGVASNVKTFTFGTPEKPVVEEPIRGDKEITVKWSKPTENGGSEIIGYNIYLNDETDPTMLVDWTKPEGSDKYQLYTTDYRNDNGRVTYGDGQETLDNFEVVIKGLANGSSYNVRVTAINGNGEGGENPIKNPITPATKAGAPRDIIAEATSGTTADIRWTKPTNNGGAAVTDYSVAVYKVGVKNISTGEYDAVEKGDAAFSGTTKGLMNVSIANLEPGCKYEVNICAINAAGPGETGTAELYTNSKPGKPTITELESGVGTEATLPLRVVWSAPKDDGDTPIIGYDVYINGTYKMNLTGMLPPDATEYTINDVRIKNGTNYDVTVVAYNAVTGTDYESGTSSDPKSITLGTIKPPKGVTAVGNINGDLTITWPMEQYTDEVKQYIDRFMIYQDGVSVSSVDGTENTNTLTLRPMGQPLTIQVAVLSTFGQLGNLSDPVTITIGAPADVTNVKASARKNGAYITWSYASTSANFDPSEFRVFLNGSEEPAKTITVTDNDIESASSALIEGLSGGKEYSITVLAHNRHGDSALSEPVKVTPFSEPDAPKIVSITPGVGEFTFEFTKPNGNGAGITEYEVYLDGEKVNAEINGTTATVRNVTDGAPAHEFYIVAVNAEGLKSAVPEKGYEIMTGVPAAPENVSIKAGVGSAEISFSASADVSETYKTTSYEIYRAAASGYTLDTIVTAVEGKETYTQKIEGLTDGTPYTFVVKAVNALGTSLESETVTVTPGTPQAPEITGIVSGSGTLTFEWTEPEKNAGKITLYTVYIYDAESGKYESVFDRNTTNATIENLDNGKPYLVAVTARNYVGEGAMSAPMSGTPGTTSEEVTNIEVKPGYADGCNMVITWTAPADDKTGGLPILSYKVKGVGTNAVSDENIKVDSANRTAIVSGLESNTEYEFSITPVNSAGDGRNASTGLVKTLSVPKAVNLFGADGADRAITLDWSKPTDEKTPITGYKLHAIPLDGGEEIVIEPPMSELEVLGSEIKGRIPEQTETTPGVTVGARYDVYVTALNVLGESEPSNKTRVTVLDDMVKNKPSAPRNVTLAAGDKAIDIKWSEPATDGNDTITGYEIYTGPSEDDMGPLATVDGHTFTYKHTGLTNGHTYYYKVKAINTVSGSDGGPFSEIVSAVPSTIAAPSMPEWPIFNKDSGVSAYESNAQQSEITIRWNESTDPAGYAVTYTVYIDGTEMTSGITETEYVLTTPAEGKTYNVQVKATNEKGISASSDFIRVKKGLNVRKSDEPGFDYGQYTDGVYAWYDGDYDGKEDDPIVVEKPSAPQNLELNTDGLKVTLTWEPPAKDGNSAISAYNVYINNSKAVVNVDNSGISAQDENSGLKFEQDIEYNKMYEFTVAAVNEQGEGEAAKSKHVYKSLTENAPTNLTGEVRDKKNIALTWDEAEGVTDYRLYINGVAFDLTETDVTVENGIVSYLYEGEINTDYIITVASKSGEKFSSPSNSVELNTDEEKALAPTGVTVEASESTGVTITWNPPTNAEAADVASYIIEANGDEYIVTAEDIAANGCTYTFDEYKTYYNIRVRGVSQSGTLGEKSDKVEFIKEEIETFDTDTPPEPKNLQFELKHDETDGILLAENNLILTWEPGDITEEHTEDTVSYKVYLNGKLMTETPITDTTYTCTVKDDTTYQVEIRPIAGNDKIGPKAKLEVGVPENQYTEPEKPVGFAAQLSDDKSEITLTWTETEGLGYYLAVNGEDVTDSTGEKVKVNSGYTFAVDESVDNYTFRLVAVKTYSDGTEKMSSPVETTVSLGGGSGEFEEYDSNAAEFVQYISNGNTSVKLFFKAPEPRKNAEGEVIETGAIEKYVVIDADTNAELATINANDTLVYEENFSSISDTRSVKIQAYKTVNGSDYRASTTPKAAVITPRCNVIDGENVQDAYNNAVPPVTNITNADADFDGKPDEQEITPKVTISGIANTDGITVTLVSAFDNEYVGTVECSEKNADGKYEFTAEFDASDLPDCDYSIKVEKEVFSMYTLKGIHKDNLSKVVMSGDYEVVMYAGDVNLDGYINTADKVKVTNNQNMKEAKPTDGDLNGDGFVNIADKVIIDNNLNKLPVSKTWKNI